MPDDKLFILLLSVGLLLLTAAVVLLIFVLRALKRAERARKEERSGALEDARRITDMLYGLPDRDEQNTQFYRLAEETGRAVNAAGTAVTGSTEVLCRNIAAGLDAMGSRLDALYAAQNARMDAFGETQERRLGTVSAVLEEKLARNEERLEGMRVTVENSLHALQTENARKLDEMRETVDEKLHATLDKRLGESFSLVNERLEQVYKGLGEMQTLAGGVGDLKRMLTNVKARGIWGEMQLGSILSQMFTPSQYAENCEIVPGSDRRVEYAVVMPGRDEKKVYLPLDSKFPLEDWERLNAAQEQADPEAVKACRRALEEAFRTEAKRISSKYICPPYSTDFAVMFVPAEGLYAEALQCRGLAEEIQEKYRVIIAGPTTLSALLTSLQVGFRTLAIEKRSGEVWRLLGAVKGEYSRFAELLETAQKRVASVSESIDSAAKKSRTIERKLRDVEALEPDETERLMGERTPDIFENAVEEP